MKNTTKGILFNPPELAWCVFGEVAHQVFFLVGVMAMGMVLIENFFLIESRRPSVRCPCRRSPRTPQKGKPQKEII